MLFLSLFGYNGHPMGPYTQRGIIQMGKHRLHYEDPGIAVLVYDGPMSADEMAILCAIPDVIEHQNQFQLTLCDVTKFGGLDGKARKLGSERPRPAKIYHSAYVGASFAMQVTVSMWVRATNILQGPKNSAAFFNDRASAKAWLIAKREEQLAGSAPK